MDSTKSFISKIYEKLSDIYDKVLGNYIKHLFSKPSTLLFLGIDNAGKTSLLKKLVRGVNDTYMPTHHPKDAKVEIGNLKAVVYDLGGHRAVRVVWNKYFLDVDGIVFIVDVSDTARFEEVKEAYNTVRELEKKAPIAVLMNKVDKLDMTSEMAENNYEWAEDLKTKTGIWDEPGTHNTQPVHISYVSILSESNDSLTGPLATSFKWLEMMINKQKEN